MTRILIVNAGSWLNKGDAGIIISMVEALKNYIPDTIISVLSETVDINILKYKNYGINVLESKRFLKSKKKSTIIRRAHVLSRLFRWSLWAVLYHFLNRDIKYLKGEDTEILNEYLNADIIVSAGGEKFYDIFGFGGNLFNLYEPFVGKLLGKPVVIYSQSIGPFKSKMDEVLAKFFLNKADLITLREEISREHLQLIGVDKPPIFVTADSAFLLHPISSQEAKGLLSEEGIDLNKPTVGMTLRHWRYFRNSVNSEEKFSSYVRIMSAVVDYIAGKLNAVVIFMPQAIVPHIEDNDIMVARDVFRLVKHKERFKILTLDYSPEELKGMIGEMDLFIGTRMHSNIFATSMCVPTVAIAYRHKTEGIMKMLGQEKYVCDINDLKLEDIIQKINTAWINRQRISKDLKSRMERIIDLTLFNAKLVKDVLDRYR